MCIYIAGSKLHLCVQSEVRRIHAAAGIHNIYHNEQIWLANLEYILVHSYIISDAHMHGT